MAWHDLWEPLQARLRAWLAAADRFLDTDATFDKVNWDQIITTTFIPEAKRIVTGFDQLAAAPDLPASEREALVSMLGPLRARFDSQRDRHGVRVFAVFLRALCAPIEHAAASTETRKKSIVERAFTHLSRSLVVDPTLRDRWAETYAEREEECEALGAVHLLGHGVFAFKVNAIGARTDLVFGDPVSIPNAARASDVLVLTEWKLVRDPKECRVKAAEAREQARLYAAGPLSGVELVSYRFLVLVSDQDLRCPDDIVDGVVQYRHICINIRPQRPSVSARNATARTPSS